MPRTAQSVCSVAPCRRAASAIAAVAMVGSRPAVAAACRARRRRAARRRAAPPRFRATPAAGNRAGIHRRRRARPRRRRVPASCRTDRRCRTGGSRFRRRSAAFRPRHRRRLSSASGISRRSRPITRVQPQLRPDCSPPISPFSHSATGIPFSARKQRGRGADDAAAHHHDVGPRRQGRIGWTGIETPAPSRPFSVARSQSPILSHSATGSIAPRAPGRGRGRRRRRRTAKPPGRTPRAPAGLLRRARQHALVMRRDQPERLAQPGGKSNMHGSRPSPHAAHSRSSGSQVQHETDAATSVPPRHVNRNGGSDLPPRDAPARCSPASSASARDLRRKLAIARRLPPATGDQPVVRALS